MASYIIPETRVSFHSQQMLDLLSFSLEPFLSKPGGALTRDGLNQGRPSPGGDRFFN